ncbi:LLM class flavin-dependent oxidoreductase [Cellulomonas sp. ATA003]|nr:LLM class flavin-dependent oxidoreductase [Cellulomonas sp. ATA003]WNB87599.1 LLM class flavin-dependent oxidoreductase [Cellulomonas sp. ATA003]
MGRQPQLPPPRAVREGRHGPGRHLRRPAAARPGCRGTGWDASVLGPPPSLAERTRRFAEFTELLDALLTQPVTEHTGEFYAAHGARMIPGCVQRPRVPFVMAANGPRAMRLAARHGQAWVTFGPSLPDDAVDGVAPAVAQDRWWDGLAVMVERFRVEAAAAGRDPDAIERHLSLDGAPVFSLSSWDVLQEGVERAVALGFTDVVVHWPRAEGIYAGSEALLERVAAELPALRTVGR